MPKTEDQPQATYPQCLTRPDAFTGYLHSHSGSGLRVGDKLYRTSYVRNHPLFRKVQSCTTLVQLQELLEDERRTGQDPLLWKAPKFIGELIAERVRTRVDIRLPSHVHCNFVFFKIGTAAIFKRLFGAPADHLFQVSVSGRWAQREMNLFSAVADEFRIAEPIDEERLTAAIQAAESTAERYWRGESLNPTLAEILVDGDVVVQADLGADVPLPDGTILPKNIDQS